MSESTCTSSMRFIVRALTVLASQTTVSYVRLPACMPTSSRLYKKNSKPTDQYHGANECKEICATTPLFRTTNRLDAKWDTCLPTGTHIGFGTVMLRAKFYFGITAGRSRLSSTTKFNNKRSSNGSADDAQSRRTSAQQRPSAPRNMPSPTHFL